MKNSTSFHHANLSHICDVLFCVRACPNFPGNRRNQEAVIECGVGTIICALACLLIPSRECAAGAFGWPQSVALTLRRMWQICACV